MADDAASNRWWENYLVRYFLPSLAGMLIVLWLVRFSAIDRYIPATLPDTPRDLTFRWKDIGTAHLVLWLLFGSLYCYVASYPALVFHATRVLDFKSVEGKPAGWAWLLLNPYVLTCSFGVAAWLSAVQNCARTALVAVSVFAGLQLTRIILATSRYGWFDLNWKFEAEFRASLAYAYLRTLSDRRATTTQETTAKGETGATGKEDKSHDPNGETTTTAKYGKDLVDSYRHLREHGNTALILFLEISLCPVLYLVVGGPTSQPNDFLFAILVAIWVLPSVFIHGFAQHLEHRFSWFECSFENTGQPHEAAITTYTYKQPPDSETKPPVVPAP
jgi:hypothetical protein